MIVVTAASGQLGRLVIASLLKTTPAANIVAAVRDPSKVADLPRWACKCAVPTMPIRPRWIAPCKALAKCC